MKSNRLSSPYFQSLTFDQGSLSLLIVFLNESDEQRHKILLGIGANLGNREKNISHGIKLLSKLGIKIIKSSSLYLSKPVGFPFQFSFLNVAIMGLTNFDPFTLLKKIKAIEKKFYRLRLFNNAPRFLDIDILFYDQEVVNSPLLKIPHPKIPERIFVLLPLLEIAPDFEHPLLKKSIKEIVLGVDQDGIKLWKKNWG